VTTTPAVPAPVAIEAAIAAVTVFPDRARVTRRGRLTLAAGEHRVLVDQLPATLDHDSVRVSGTGAATVAGVDVVRRFPPRDTAATAERLRQELREALARLAALEDEDAVAQQRLEFYAGLAKRSTRTCAGALASGDTDPVRVAELADALASAQAGIRQDRRALVDRRERAREEVEALQNAANSRQNQRQKEFRAVSVELLVPADGEIDLEVSYVVAQAGWHSAYDLRLADRSLTLSWYGLVTQRTGEDWPECDLRLSTARPSGTAAVPELDPWFLDRVRPVMAAAPMMARSFGAPAPGGPPAQAFAVGATDGMVLAEVAQVEQGATAATYRPARPVAVPADGSAHRATLAVVELEAVLDYVTAPVRAAEAHLRATVTNTSAHTLPRGSAAVFHGNDFVGATPLEVWAPGEEVELALGVDDRVRVERELVRRGATKAMLGAARRRDTEHRIRVTNHTPGPARITVLDQLPVSRDEGIVVKEQRVDPAPAERTELGVLTWILELAPGTAKDIHLAVRVETARGVELAGWRE
jgi:uncharacterized protein (TIGR02231 family)